MSEREPRTTAEWFTLAGSCAVLGVVVVLIVVQLLSSRDPAAPVAVLEGTRRVGDVHHVEVTVTNEGDDTAADIQVNADLTIDGEVVSADQVIDFLSGGEDEDLVFVFEDDPAEGELEVVVSGFSVP
jgi:uncharacterized protein (TIGR02588 family)